MKIYTLAEDYAGYESPFLAQHGISFLIEYKGKKLLFDAGQNAAPILYNMKLLGLDPRDVDYIFLSHCHYDHTGGLVEILKETGKRIPVIAHPTIFRKHFITKPHLRHVGLPFTREEVEKYGELFLSEEPFQIIEGLYSTGEIREKEDFERTNLEVYTLSKGRLVRDELRDDMSIAIKTPKGLVVVSGCSHAGIISIVEHSMRLTGEKKVRAVIGGFHLIEANEDRIRMTVEAFRQLGVEEVYTGHCTGLKAEAAFLEAYGNRFHKLHAGMVIM